MMMMSTQKQKPSFCRVLSDTSRVISSDSLHFLTLALLFIFPISLFNIINSFTNSSPTPSHYGRLLSTVSNHVSDSDSEIPPLDKSQILFQLLYGLVLLHLKLCSVPSITHSVFHGFHNNPLKLASSLKSILPSFFPLLATKIAYVVIMGAIIFGFGCLMGFVFFGLALLGFQIEPNSQSLMIVVFVMAILLLVLFVYLGVECFLMDAIVVVESKCGFAPFQRSSNLVKGARGVAFLIMLLFWILQAVLSAWYSTMAAKASTSSGCGWVVMQMLVYAAFSTMLSLFSLAANTVLFVYCKSLQGEFAFPTSTDDKLGHVYVQLPRDVVDDV